MRYAFCIFKYFPFGGIQRDGLKIAQTLVQRGHQIRFYALSWDCLLYTSDAADE